MKRYLVLLLTFGLGLGFVTSSFAEYEKTGAEIATAEAPAVTEAPAADAAVAVEADASAVIPSVEAAEGTISEIDVKSDTPWVKIKDAAGKEWTVNIDPKSSVAVRADKTIEWSELAAGQHVRIGMIQHEGTQIAKTIQLI